MGFYVGFLIKFKDTNESISSSKESIGSPWHDLVVEICKISPLDTSDTSEHL